MCRPSDPGTLSRIFLEMENGAEDAEERIFDLVYHELEGMAHRQMAREAPGNTLDTNALVHEAYIRLFRGEGCRWENRRHFFGSAARAMRRILVDRARRKRAVRHGGTQRRAPLLDHPADTDHPEDRIALDQALTLLDRENDRVARVFSLRYFLGMTVHEVAEVLGVSPKTVDNDWALSRAWLRRELSTGTGPR